MTKTVRSGTDAVKSLNGFLPRNANFAGQGRKSKSTIFVSSQTWLRKVEQSARNGCVKCRLADARRWWFVRTATTRSNMGATMEDPLSEVTLESLVTRKLSSGARRGAIGKVPKGNSLVAYPTARTVLREERGGNAASPTRPVFRPWACRGTVSRPPFRRNFALLNSRLPV